MTTDFDVVAIGNALVDVISHEAFEILDELGLDAGSMTLVDAPTADRVYDRMGPATEVSGGSAGNMVAGVADFGGRAAFIGRVADDTFGRLYVHDLRSIGVHFAGTPVADASAPTGRCLVLVTPDAQRTMCTYLGAGTDLDPSFVDEQVVARSSVLYLEGYLWDQPPAMEAFRAAATCAHRAGRKVALTLSDRFCVERHRAGFLQLIEGDVDILFANEAEILALYEVDEFDDALQLVRGHCEIAALTRSAKGSIVVAGDEVHVVDAAPVAYVVDTTGAGDLYAAGFLYGYTRGYDLATCGDLGSVAAAEVISHIGPRPVAKLADLAARVLATARVTAVAPTTIDLIGVDGDDTLWHNEAYFRLSETRFAALLAPWADADHLAARLLETERANLDRYGYGAKAFVLSMVETALDVTEHRVSGEVIAELLRLGKQILSHPVELLDGVAATVPRLAALAPTVLITKGDLIHQEAKVAGSGLGEHFAGVEIVAEKDVETYARVLARYAVAPERFVMVGNSVRSDVLPVLELGGRAVHVPHEHAWEHERADLPAHERCQRVTRLTEVPACLREQHVTGLRAT